MNAALDNNTPDNSTKNTSAKSGDVLTIDFKGMINGVAFEGGTASDCKVELGSHQFIPGFEEQLVGAKVGDNKEVKVTFPADYPSAEVAGKEANFAVTVKGIQSKEVPEVEAQAGGETPMADQSKPPLLSDEQLQTVLRHGPELKRIEQAVSPELRKVLVDLQRNAAGQYASGNWQVPATGENIVVDMPQKTPDMQGAQQALGQSYLTAADHHIRATVKGLMDTLGLTPSAPRSAVQVSGRA